jgi:hypothetical protein
MIMALIFAINSKFNYLYMNYTEELKRILLGYTRSFPTLLYFETDRIFVKLVLEDKTDSKFKFEIRNKISNRHKWGNPFRATSRNITNKYQGYLSQEVIQSSQLDAKSFNEFSKQSVNILKQIQPKQYRHQHP